MLVNFPKANSTITPRALKSKKTEMRKSMDQVILATCDNSLYRRDLEAHGFSLGEYTPGLTPPPLKSTGPGPYIIAEIKGQNITALQDMKSAFPASEILCLVPSFEEKMRGPLIELGLSDLLKRWDPPGLASLVGAMAGRRGLPLRGRIAVLEESVSFLGILSSISSRFGFATENTPSINGLIDYLENNSVELVLVNIGCRGFDIAEFIKKAYANSAIKKYPLVAYKDLAEGLYVHEITSGLNRLTKSILSREELLNLLVTLLFRAETGPLINEINALHECEGLTGENGSTLRRLFYDAGTSLCECPEIFSENRYARYLDVNRKLEYALTITDPLRWLIGPSKKGPTCAGGA